MGLFFSRPARRPQGPNSALSRPQFTVRNLTVTPLELKFVESFDSAVVHGALELPSNRKATRRLNNMSCVISPFSSFVASKELEAPEEGREILRLTIAHPGTDRRYVVEVPGPSARSLVLKHVEPAEEDRDAPEFTAIYVSGQSTLAIFNSANLQRWMGELNGAYPLNMLSIPGTHNSPTHHVALPSVRCQAVSVREQLRNGVRFLDVRVSCSPLRTGGNKDSDEAAKLALVHGIFPISLFRTKYLANVLAEVYAFLDAHPTETVLVSLKREGPGRGTDQDLSKLLAASYCSDPNRWFTEPRVPVLDEVRGRAVLIRRFCLDSSLAHLRQGRWGIDGSAWPDNCADGTCGGGQIRIQDVYEVGGDAASNVARKIELAHAQLERAASQLFEFDKQQQQRGIVQRIGEEKPIYVNFLSASNFFNKSCWPEKIAAKVNPSVVEYLCTRHGVTDKGPEKLVVGNAATGVVVTDWVGLHGDWDLVRCIVGWNARLQLEQ